MDLEGIMLSKKSASKDKYMISLNAESKKQMNKTKQKVIDTRTNKWLPPEMRSGAAGWWGGGGEEKK